MRLVVIFVFLFQTSFAFAQVNLNESTPFGMRWVYAKSFPKKKYHVYDADDNGVIYNNNVKVANCFFVLSKREFRLYVYESVNGDTSLVAHFPVCFARNTGDKHRAGDGTTPVCTKDTKGEYIPFTIAVHLQNML